MGLIIKGKVINDSTGTIQTKCPKCKNYNVIRGPVVVHDLKCECGYIFVKRIKKDESIS